MQSPTVVDCFMNASLAGQGSFAAIEACSRVAPWPGSKKWITKHELPELHSWHVTTQERLFDHLRQVWPDDRPRVMVDLGCHAGHGRYKNISDTLLWLQRFNSSGSLVLGVDLSEDYALDLQHRFDEVPPFSTLRGVTKRTLHTAVSYLDGKTINFKREIMMGVTCCGGEWCAVWDKLDAKRNGTYSDHYCRITRQRLHASPSTLPLPTSTASRSFNRRKKLHISAVSSSCRYIIRTRQRIDLPLTLLAMSTNKHARSEMQLMIQPA